MLLKNSSRTACQADKMISLRDVVFNKVLKLNIDTTWTNSICTLKCRLVAFAKLEHALVLLSRVVMRPFLAEHQQLSFLRRRRIRFFPELESAPGGGLSDDLPVPQAVEVVDCASSSEHEPSPVDVAAEIRHRRRRCLELAVRSDDCVTLK